MENKRDYPRGLKKEIFKEELNQLHQEKYINEEEYQKLNDRYEQFHISQLNKLKESAIHSQKQRSEKTDHNIFIQSKVKEVKKETVIQSPPKVKEQKVLTPEQLRERNISWLLILGVILLLIAGITLATSNWDNMNDLLKVASMSFVAILFFAISIFSRKVLKIEKTSFSFLILGSLFIPIISLTAGYLRLFGEWLSIYGDGKYLLGSLTSVICLIIYFRNSVQYKSRFFTWLTLITATITYSFVLASTTMPRDLFYCGIALYNLCLLFVYVKTKNNTNYKWFIKEIPVFSQLNLILSALLTLFFFDNYALYSFNIILTSIAFIGMTYVYKQKNYHFVFSFLIVYGIYQLIEHTPLQYINVVLFSLIGFIFLGMLQYNKGHTYFEKVYQYTSAFVSALAFIYISFGQVLYNINNSSLLILISYLILSVNYIYLSHLTKNIVFRYLAPIMLSISAYRCWMMIEGIIKYDVAEIFLTLATTIIFYFVCYKNKHKYLLQIRKSSLHVVIVNYILLMLYALVSFKFMSLSIILFIVSSILFITTRKEINIKLTKICNLIIPVLWAFCFFFFLLFFDYNEYLHLEPTIIIAFTGLLLMGISDILRRKNLHELSKTSYVTGLVTYSLSVFLFGFVENMYVRVIILFVGLAIYALSVYRLNKKWIWLCSSICFVLLYISIIEIILNFIPLTNSNLVTSAYILSASLILISECIGRKVKDLKPYYFWTAQAITPFVIFYHILAALFGTSQTIMIVIPLLIYVYSTLIQKNEILRRIFLYVTFSLLNVSLMMNLEDFNFPLDSIEYGSLISVAIISILWAVLNKAWKDRISYYLIALIFLTISYCLLKIDLYLMDFAYIGTLIPLHIFLLHKHNLKYLNVLPLMMSILLVFRITSEYDFSSMYITLILIMMSVVLKFMGDIFYKKLTFNKNIDWYTIFSCIYLYAAYQGYYADSTLLIQLIMNFVLIYRVYTFKQRLDESSFNTINALTLAISFAPYYAVLEAIDVNEYIETELYVLPAILFIILIKKFVWNNKSITQMEWAVTLVATAFLLIDALTSHTYYDAIILGALALISILGGFHYKIKSYFLIGCGVLLLNVFLQTTPLWSNLPWWVYLLVAGLTLIIFASRYEWNKQKRNNDNSTSVNLKDKFKSKFKEWK